MTAMESVLARYKEAEKDDEMHVAEGYIRVYEYKNSKLRKQLREEYISLLPLNQRIAIMMHSKLCKHDHTASCGFYYGVKGIQDDWKEYTHKEYLKKADKLIEVLTDSGVPVEKVYDTAENIIECCK